MSFDKLTASSFFICSVPQTSSVISRAHGFTNVSPIVCGFFSLAMRQATSYDASRQGLCLDESELWQSPTFLKSSLLTTKRFNTIQRIFRMNRCEMLLQFCWFQTCIGKDFTTQKTLRCFTAITISNEGKTKNYIVFTVLPLFFKFSEWLRFVIYLPCLVINLLNISKAQNSACTCTVFGSLYYDIVVVYDYVTKNDAPFL